MGGRSPRVEGSILDITLSANSVRAMVELRSVWADWISMSRAGESCRGGGDLPGEPRRDLISSSSISSSSCSRGRFGEALVVTTCAAFLGVEAAKSSGEETTFLPIFSTEAEVVNAAGVEFSKEVLGPPDPLAPCVLSLFSTETKDVAEVCEAGLDPLILASGLNVVQKRSLSVNMERYSKPLFKDHD